MKAEVQSSVAPASDASPGSAASAKSAEPRAILNRLGPFFGLVLVFALFAALLGAKDVVDQHAALTAGTNPAAADVSWW